MKRQGSARDRITERLLEAVDQLRTDVARVDMWATALIGFSEPIPDYNLDQHMIGKDERDPGAKARFHGGR